MIGAGAIYAAQFIAKNRKKTSKWARTEGKLIWKKIDFKKLSSATRANYRIYLEYEYSFQGKVYTGNNYYAIELEKGEHSFLEYQAKKELDRIPENLMVYVNPSDPTESFIIKEGSFFIWVCYLMGIPAIIAGIIILLITLI